MKCVKVPRRDLSQVKIPKAPGYDIVFEGDFALIPIIEEVKGLEIVECLPKKRDVTPRLNEIVNGISSFYIIGDIMVLSPKNELPRETLQKILDMYKVRSIYVKKRVSGELRVSELIHLAGEKRTATTFSENGIKYFVDISKVYVNPSMATERIKMAEVIPPGSIVLDAFTGYGALALHLAKRLGYAVAGDLNLDGLLMALVSVKMNSKKILVDLVQYDAKHLPFRGRVFDWVIGDNPTMIMDFIDEMCRVGKTLVIYKLGRLEEGWERVNDYSKDLVIMKRLIRCNEDNVDLSFPESGHQISS